MNSMVYKKESPTSCTLFNRVRAGLIKFDPDVFKLLTKSYKQEVAIAGGAIRSIISKTHINDMDLYLTDDSVISTLINDLIELKYVVLANTDNALTLKHSETNKLIQVIKKIYIDPTEPTSLFSDFDFTVTCAVFYEDTLYLGETFLEDLASRSLVVVNKSLQFPIATLVRTLKYQRYGFKASSILMVNLALQIHALDISTYADLKRQLQGIDTTIFDALLSDVNDRLEFTVPDMLTYLSENYFNYLEN